MAPTLSIILISIVLLASCGPSRENRIVIGSKNFTEQAVLGEIFAQMLEGKTNLRVERRFYLAGSFICQQAILSGRIDLYPEYTGTALTAILKEQPQGSREQVYQRVKSEYERRFQLTLGPPLGFNDTFAIEIRFAAAPRIMDLGLLSRALKDKQVDLIAGNTTDGLIPAFDFSVLQDDRNYFPPYEAVAVIRQATIGRHPEVGEILGKLAGKISDQDMQQLNYAVDGQHRDSKAVVREFLERKGLK